MAEAEEATEFPERPTIRSCCEYAHQAILPSPFDTSREEEYQKAQVMSGLTLSVCHSLNVCLHVTVRYMSLLHHSVRPPSVIGSLSQSVLCFSPLRPV